MKRTVNDNFIPAMRSLVGKSIANLTHFHTVRFAPYFYFAARQPVYLDSAEVPCVCRETG